MFSLMGNCISSIRQRRQPKKPLTLALLGVDNAGKTTASISYAGEPLTTDVAPTLGFRNVKFTFEQYEITLFDIGGGKNIRPVWKNYFPEVYGIIYLVDSSTAERMDEVRDTFRESLEHPHVSGKPVLLLANKQDKPDALDEVDICDLLNLETVVNTNKCPCRIDPCSALRGSGKKMDPHMKDGLRWLLGMVEKHWDQLHVRVENDKQVVEELRKAEAAARKERVRKLREERERQEEEERKRLGITKQESDEEDFVDGNPFQPLDLKQLKKKEEALKAKKKNKKELASQESKELDKNGEALFNKTPRLSLSRSEAQADNPLDSRKAGDKLFSVRSRPSALPPLEPLGTPFVEDGTQNKKKKKKKKPLSARETPTEKVKQSQDKAASDDEDIVMATPRSQPVLSESRMLERAEKGVSSIKVSTHDNFPSRQMLAAGISRVPPHLDENDRGEGGGDADRRGDAAGRGDDAEIDTPRTRKVKKKKLRDLALNHNGQARLQGMGAVPEVPPLPTLNLTALDGGDIVSAERNSTAEQRKKKVKKHRLVGPSDEEKYELSPRYVFGKDLKSTSPPEEHSSRLSRNSQMHSNISIGSDHFGSKTWGLAEDLPTVADEAVAFRQPNFVNDDDAIL